MNLFALLQTGAPPSNLIYLFAAFGITWVVFFTYAYFLSRRRQEIQREVRDLRQSLGPAAGPP